MRDIFLNRHGEIRSGWKLSIFVVFLSVFFFILVVPFQLLEVKGEFLSALSAAIGILAATFIMTRRFHHKPLTAVGLSLHPGIFRELGIGCLLGVLTMSGIFLIEYSLGYAERFWLDLGVWTVLWTVISSMASFLVAAVAEELLFRGYPFQVLMQGVTFLPATIIVALLFGAAHLANPHASALGFINTVLVAVLLALAYMKTRSLWLPFGFHFSWNFSQTTVFGFPTSGISFSGFQLFRSVQAGPEWVTGGGYGPEGGILATIGLIATTWYILKASYLTAPEGIVTLDSVEDLLPPQAESTEIQAGHS